MKSTGSTSQRQISVATSAFRRCYSGCMEASPLHDQILERPRLIATPTRRQLPIAPSPSSPYIGHMRRLHKGIPSFPRRREPRTLPHADPLALWERVRVRVRGRECNEMQSNATELKVSPLLATPDEANQGHNQGRLAHRLRVNGGPNGATVASFPASPPGVNEAKRAKWVQESTLPRRSREGGNLASPALQIPSPSGRGLG